MSNSASPPDVGQLYRHIGERITRFREEKGFTQSDLAGRIGLSRTSVGQFETGHQHPSLEALYFIAHALERDISEIIPSVTEIAADPRRFADQVARDRSLSDDARTALLDFLNRHASVNR